MKDLRPIIIFTSVFIVMLGVLFLDNIKGLYGLIGIQNGLLVIWAIQLLDEKNKK